ncbi:MAG TPA: hypothetical protein VJ719_01280 [Chthoniobacterales bacterium]|nr:hypothetical protein [Chthoniobacterales bacterium]
MRANNQAIGRKDPDGRGHMVANEGRARLAIGAIVVTIVAKRVPRASAPATAAGRRSAGMSQVRRSPSNPST